MCCVKLPVSTDWFNPSIAHQCYCSSEYVLSLSRLGRPKAGHMRSSLKAEKCTTSTLIRFSQNDATVPTTNPYPPSRYRPAPYGAAPSVTAERLRRLLDGVYGELLCNYLAVHGEGFGGGYPVRPLPAAGVAGRRRHGRGLASFRHGD